MKTAQVIRRLNFGEWGGTENVVWNTALALAESGDRVEVLATRALGGAAVEERDGVSIRRFPYRYPYFPLSREKIAMLDKKGGNPRVPALERYLRNGGFDLIHVHNLGRLAELAARAAEDNGIPLVVSLHGGCFDVPDEERRELVRPLRHTLPYGGALERFLHQRREVLKCASGIICVGENELDGLRRRYPDKRVLYLPNGVYPERFSAPCSFDWRRELKLAVDEKLLLNVSRVDYQKNQLALLKLLKRLIERGEPAHLLLIGPVSAKWYGDELRRFAMDNDLEKRFTLVPGLPPEDERLRAAYAQADKFLLPSVHEPFGIVVLEAWSAGVPVISADVGGVGRLVTEGETGTKFVSGDADSLLAAYDRSPERGSSICRRALEVVRERYDWRVVTARLRQFYREVAAHA